VTTSTRPALVAQDAAQRLPRVALWLFCAAYVLPGLFGRDPWRGADLSAFGQMLAMAEGRAPWLLPALGGVPTDGALLPHWIGAASIALTSSWLDPALAARIPFAGLLVLTLVAVWYAAFNLARSDAAQPLPFAFGGEASAVDYARAIADGAVLAVIATLGLLQLGHETTPELAQLASMAGFQWALSAAPQRRMAARSMALVSLPALAASGAPAMALALGLGSVALAWRDRHPQQRELAPWLACATAMAAAVAWPVHSWAWRLSSASSTLQLGRFWLWFLWPSWLLAGWTLWRWRGHLEHRHLSVPLLGFGVAAIASIAMGGSDRALMLGLPGIAVLAAFALPTLKRSASAAIDWFSVFFFTLAAAVFWFYYVAMQTGQPTKAADSIARLVRGFEPHLSIVELLIAACSTLAWLWLVRWRTSRHRAALWKSLVLPAGGVALCWLLLMTLGLPVIDHARSYRPLIERLAAQMPAGACVAAPDASQSLVAALEYHARRRVDASPGAASGPCPVLVLVARGVAHPPPPPGWRESAVQQRPTERNEYTLLYQR
jgi:4-amino-4-deoxy-L-arabinose transferase-like glycosyltransferase